MISFDDHLVCPLCNGYFDDPRMLRCTHTFCAKCLVSNGCITVSQPSLSSTPPKNSSSPSTQSPSPSSSSPSSSSSSRLSALIARRNSKTDIRHSTSDGKARRCIRCPECRMDTFVTLPKRRDDTNGPVKITSLLPVNTLAVDAIQDLKAAHSPCDECNEAVCELYCKSCDARYCFSCSSLVHSFRTNRDHELTEISSFFSESERSQNSNAPLHMPSFQNRKKNPPLRFCPKHPSQALSLYDQTIGQLCCGVCALSRSSNLILSLDRASLILRGQLSEAIQRAESTSKMLAPVFREVASKIQSALDVGKTTRQKIKAHFIEIQQQLNDKEKDLLVALEKIESKCTQILRERANHIQANRKATEYVCNSSKLLAGDFKNEIVPHFQCLPSHVVELAPKFKIRLEELSEERLHILKNYEDKIEKESTSDFSALQVKLDNQVTKAVENLQFISNDNFKCLIEIPFPGQNRFGEEGVIDSLARCMGKAKWKCPLSTGTISAEASSVLDGSLGAVVSGMKGHHDGQYLQTLSDRTSFSYFAIDLGAHRALKPYGYRISYFNEGEDHIPQSWDLQVAQPVNFSNLIEDKEEDDVERRNIFENVKWVTISRHCKDKSMFDAPHIASFPILWQEQKRNENYFRLFRIKLTGSTSSGTHYLVLSGLELYGRLVEVRKFSF
eukprot:g955.t1